LPDAFNSELELYPYDVAAAQALLEESGWVDSDGDGVREKEGTLLELELIYLPPPPSSGRACPGGD
jgi:ABC-type transport system substrate-binding protein